MEEQNTQFTQKITLELQRQLAIMQDSIFGGTIIGGGEIGDDYLFASENFARLQGYSPQELIEVTGGKTWNNILEEDRPQAKKSWEEQLSKGNRFVLTFRVKHKNGNILYVKTNGLRVVEPTGDIRFYCVAQDVTKDIEKTMELKNLIAMQKQMVECLDCGVVAYTLPQRKLLMLNKEAQRILGCSASSFKANITTLENIVTEDRRMVFSKISSMKDVGDGFSCNFRVKKKDDSLLYVECQANLFEFEDKSRFVLTVLKDVTQWTLTTSDFRMKKQQELEEANRSLHEQMRMIKSFSSIYFATWSLNLGTMRIEEISVPNWLHGIVADSNNDGQKAFDYMIQTFITEKGSRKLMKDFLKIDTVKERMQNEQILTAEYISNITAGWRAGNFIVIDRDEKGFPLNVIYAIRNIDATKRRELDSEKALKVAYDTANRANAAKTDFLSRMSHDIRTPMNAIIGLVAIAGTHIDDKERLCDCLAKINVSSKHLLALINEVLDMSRIESGKIALQEEPFNISRLIDDLLVIIKPQIQAKGHDLNIHINKVDHENVIGDALRLQQVLLNIIGNSIKYTPSGGNITIGVRERSTKSSLTTCYEFVICDSGIGMSKKFLKKIFEPFEREENPTVSKTQGTGLGMAIAKNIVNMMNGDIKVQSTQGEGSKFTITVYFKLPEDEAQQEDTTKSYSGLSVLVVDDDLISCQSAVIMLESIGMESQYVQTGKEAVEKVVSMHKKNEDFFAVIIDWQMPQMNGIETTKRIREQVGPDVPVIIFSSYDWSDIEQEARAAGVNMFISKPLFKSKLIYTFDTILGVKKEDTSVGELPLILDKAFPGKRILIAEDNELNAEIAKEILEMMQIEVDVASNGKETLEKFSSCPEGFYDLIFLDIQMPQMNGYEAASALRVLERQDAKTIPIIAMTANAFAEDVIAAKNAGMNEHIAKPLDINKLKKLLAKWLK